MLARWSILTWEFGGMVFIGLFMICKVQIHGHNLFICRDFTNGKNTQTHKHPEKMFQGREKLVTVQRRTEKPTKNKRGTLSFRHTATLRHLDICLVPLQVSVTQMHANGLRLWSQSQYSPLLSAYAGQCPDERTAHGGGFRCSRTLSSYSNTSASLFSISLTCSAVSFKIFISCFCRVTARITCVHSND